MFDGRVRRSTYFWLNVVGVIVGVSLALYDTSGLLTPIFLVVFGIVHISFAVRRLHDIGYSWLVVLLLFVPVANVVLWLILFFKGGTVGPNEYGPDPRGRRGRASVVANFDAEPAAPKASGPIVDRLAALEKLGSMRERGLLSPEEYQSEKSRLG